MFAMLNDRYSTESYVRNVMERGYGIDFYAGDEDNGEMSAWYVLSAMGLYPLGLGGLTGEYVMGVPLFNHLHVTFPIASSSTTSSASSHQFYEHLMAPLSSEPMENLDILAIGSDVNHYHVKSILLNSNKVATFSSQWDIGDHPQRIPANIISHRDFMKTNSVLQFVIDADVENGKPCTILTHELLMKTEVENEYSHSLQDKNPHATPLLPPPDIGREHPVSDSLNAIILDLENKERQDKVDLTKQKQQEQDVALKEKQAQWEKEHQEHHEEAAQQQLELDTLTHTTETQAAIIKQLQLQLDSSRHEIHQHIAKSEVNSHSHGAAAVSLEDTNKFADPIPDHDHDSVISKILHRIINTYPTYMILLIWCFGSLSILILVALSVSYIYVLFITKCCSKYVNASQLCHEQDTEQCDGSDSNSGSDGSNWCARSLTLFLKNLVGSKTQLMKKHEVYNV